MLGIHLFDIFLKDMILFWRGRNNSSNLAVERAVKNTKNVKVVQVQKSNLMDAAKSNNQYLGSIILF